MKHRITTDSMTHEFRLLRNRIESEIQAPALIFVTSATARDGASLTAYGLAESLSNTGQRTVLLTTDMSIASPTQAAKSTNGFRRRASDAIAASSASGPANDGRFSVVAISPERLKTISRGSVADMLQELRADNHYVIIDAGDLATNSFALLLVASADAALIAFRSGRSQQPADRVMLDALERTESRILGVVITDEAAIAHFAARGDEGSGLLTGTSSDLQPAHKSPSTLARRLEVALSRRGKSN